MKSICINSVCRKCGYVTIDDKRRNQKLCRNCSRDDIQGLLFDEQTM